MQFNLSWENPKKTYVHVTSSFYILWKEHEENNTRNEKLRLLVLRQVELWISRFLNSKGFCAVCDIFRRFTTFQFALYSISFLKHFDLFLSFLLHVFIFACMWREPFLFFFIELVAKEHSSHLMASNQCRPWTCNTRGVSLFYA